MAGFGLHTDFSKSERTDRLVGFFTDVKWVGMIEEKDEDCIDIDCLFIAKMIDRCCGLTGECMTKFLVKNGEIYHRVFRYSEKLGRTLPEIANI